jgi:hypothetical protein
VVRACVDGHVERAPLGRVVAHRDRDLRVAGLRALRHRAEDRDEVVARVGRRLVVQHVVDRPVPGGLPEHEVRAVGGLVRAAGRDVRERRVEVVAVAELERLVLVRLIVRDLLDERVDRRRRAEARVVLVDRLVLLVARRQRRDRGHGRLRPRHHDRAGRDERVVRELERAARRERAVVADALAAHVVQVERGQVVGHDRGRCRDDAVREVVGPEDVAVLDVRVGVGAGDRLECERRVLDRPVHGPGRVLRGRDRRDPVAGDEPDRGPQADEALRGRRADDRARGLRADRQHRHRGGSRGRGAGR